MDNEIIDIYDLEKRIREGENIDMENILIRLPDGNIVTFEEYTNGPNLKYSTNDHAKSPMLKKRKPVPPGVGSKSKKRSKRYWEE